MTEVFVTSIPFAANSTEPLDVLAGAGVVPEVNPLGRKPAESELVELLGGARVVLAGTEPLTGDVLRELPSLGLIARMGVGLDGVDLDAARDLGIAVTYTPSAPAPAVADMAVALMMSLLRGLPQSSLAMRSGEWRRVVGRRLAEVTVGLVGVGAIGSELVRLLDGLGVRRLLLHDLIADDRLDGAVRGAEIRWTTLEGVLEEADVVSLHLPATADTIGLIGRRELCLMKEDAVLVNTARGGLVDEVALVDVLAEGHLSGVGLDVFADEPYTGPLGDFDRCLLTSHMASSTVDCRTAMEVEAAWEAVRFLAGDPLASPVPGMGDGRGGR